jgi:large subunit ribosomal protein L25
MSELNIEVQTRDRIGSGASRRLRREGLVPAVVYGGGRDTVPIQVDRRILLDLLKQAGSENAVLLLKLDGGSKQRHCMVRELEVDPLTRQILHVDFLRIDMAEKVRVMIAVETVGVPQGVKNEGGILDQVTREVEVECLPGDIPRSVEIDVSELHIGQHLEAGDLTMPKGVELTEDTDKVLVSVAAPRMPEEEEEEAEEMLLEAEMEEPELVGRGKDEEEGEEEDEG